ncbi:hypothetical protein JD844_028531 [Phrynosoma platyrhinos]|uniref:WASH complex subunit 3 n=1 Tax=Phrynosoma platyrhinos TaxID=52577 RepID=A0ABQ7SI10_PHRPL|nr:hypothetical protein JD844_028531 [Phrynosoma platyrhinos]
MDEDGLPLVGSGIDLTKKLSALSLRIQQIETTLNILDAKLSSIPGLEDVKFEVSSTSDNNITNGLVSQPSIDPQSPNASPHSEGNSPEVEQQKPEEATKNVTTVAKDPRYARYLKMVQVCLELKPRTPDAAVPAWGDEANAEETSDSESSFSD